MKFPGAIALRKDFRTCAMPQGSFFRLEPDDVVAEMNHRAPPDVAEVPPDLDAERAVVPGGAEPSVDLARGKGDAPALAEGDDGVHDVGHGEVLLPGRWRRPLA